MNELEIKGKKYISSKRASELTGYAKDYVGQLARAGKIAGTRVGRAWYVDEAALLAHANSETGTTLSVTQETKPTLSPLQPKRVVISPSTLRAMGYGMQRLPETWSPALYFSDDADLIPRIPKYDQNRALKSPLSGTIVRIKVMEKNPLEISEKARKIKEKRGFEDSVLSFGAVAAAMGILVFCASGFVLSSHIAVQGSQGANTANLALGFEYVHDTLMKFPPFAMGVSSLQSFFVSIGNSFANFLDAGIGFIIKGIHWIISLV